jgi:hypothetical protein
VLLARVVDIDQAQRTRTALDLVLDRLGYWIDDQPSDATVEVWMLDELRGDVIDRMEGGS